MSSEPLLSYFRGDGSAAASPRRIDNAVLTDDVLLAQTAPSGYRLLGEQGRSVVTAVNVALVLRAPLLVAGEPGSGKTQLAYGIANELGRPAPMKFVTKSTSQAQDLLYVYDAVQHFRAGQTGVARDVREFIDYSALGLAILLGLPLEQRRAFLAPSLFAAELAPTAVQAALRAPEPQQAVVLVDEIDKAARDFPNDLLTEVETLTFRIPELGGAQTPAPAPSYRPIIVVTTNSERPLPDAFLRRCVYVHLECPSGEHLDAILASRLEDLFAASSILLRDARRLFEQVRAQGVLDKNPGLAELIQFLQALAASGADTDLPIAAQREPIVRALPTLAKSTLDHQRLRAVVDSWSG